MPAPTIIQGKKHFQKRKIRGERGRFSDPGGITNITPLKNNPVSHKSCSICEIEDL